jgi:hypothetical protein
MQVLLFTLIVTTTMMASPTGGSDDSVREGVLEQLRTKINGHSVELRKFRSPIQFPSGKTKFADITMVFETRTGLFWWDYYQPTGPDFSTRSIAEMLSRDKFYIGAGRIARFALSGSDLRIRQCAERYQSIEDGQAHALREIRANAANIEQNSWHWFHLIDLVTAKALEREFMMLTGSASPLPEPKIREVARKNGAWQLIIDGPNKDTAEVVLNDAYEVVRAKRFLPKANEK